MRSAPADAVAYAEELAAAGAPASTDPSSDRRSCAADPRPREAVVVANRADRPEPDTLSDASAALADAGQAEAAGADVRAHRRRPYFAARGDRIEAARVEA